MSDAPTTARPFDTHTHSDAPLEGGASSGRQAYDLGSATLSEVREAGKQAHTAVTTPLEIHDPGSHDTGSHDTGSHDTGTASGVDHGPHTSSDSAAGGQTGGINASDGFPSSSYSGGSPGGDAGSTESTDSLKASTTAADLDKQSEAARGQFGQAETDKDRAAAVTKMEGIVRDADKNHTDVKDSSAKAGEEMNPGITDAMHDMDKATQRVVSELKKTDDASGPRIENELNNWDKGDNAQRAASEARLRADGNGGLADALGGVRSAREKNADKFSHGEEIEQRLHNTHGKGIQDSTQAMINSRSDLQQAYLMSGRRDDAARIGSELQSLREKVANFTPIGN